MMISTGFDLLKLRAGLKPFRLYWFPRLRSTSDHAARMRAEGRLFAPSVVLTGHQLAGRGRGTNSWWSGAGGLTVTFCLPIDPELQPHQIPLLAGLAVRRAAARLSGSEEIRIKWPNDILHDGLKLAGLLCERISRVDLVGVGLNVNTDPARAPLNLRNKVTSLAALLGRSVDLSDTVVEVGRQLQLLLVRREEGSFGTLLREYDRHHALNGRRVRVTDNDAAAEGVCEGLDPEGRLLLRSESDVKRVLAGHVEIL